ncbi:MAG TPA: M23 family metallopeptidase [Baekduia sp.]|nr:M23 family metallopeptidase [Baekduia sp.]
MRLPLPARLAAPILLPVLSGAAGVAAAAGPDAPQRGLATVASGSLLAAGTAALGDVDAALQVRRTAERRAAAARRRALTRELRRSLRFPVAGRADFGAAAARFGDDRGSHMHEGQDLFAPAGTPVRALAGGVVVQAGGGDERGNHVAIHDRRRNRTYVYFHLQSAPTVRLGQRVRAGRRIGRVGCTGRCFGDHLHFEVRRGGSPEGEPLDPMGLLRRARRA